MKWLDKIVSEGRAGWTLLLYAALYIPYIILCFYAHPVADDYLYSSGSPFWKSQLQAYLDWNGRYSANFMVISNPIISNSIALYRLVAFCLLLMIPMATYFLLSSLLAKLINFTQRVLLAAIASLFILSLLPSLPEGIYWYPGSTTYILGAILAMFYIGLVVKYINGEYVITRLFHLCICILLLCLCIGFNEVQMFLFLVGHLISWLYIKKQDEFRSVALVLLLFTLAFSALVFFAPGNDFRGSKFPDNHNLINSLYMSFLQMPRFFFYWVSYAPLIIGSILFAPISFKLNNESMQLKKLGSLNPWLFFMGLWAILFICIFPAYWSTAILGQHRTLNTACFFFIPMWFLFVHSLYSRMNMSEKVTQLLSRPILLGLILLLAGCLLFSGNSGTAIVELTSGKVAAFSKEMNLRDSILVSAHEKGLKEVAIPLLKDRPNSLFVLDIQPGHYYWVNQMYARFYRFNKVYADSTIIRNN